MQIQEDDNSTDLKAPEISAASLTEYFNIIREHRRIIGYIVGATFILSIIGSLLQPNSYIATARILPPDENNFALSALLSDADSSLNGLASHFIGETTPATQYLGIMKSRTVADALIKKFDLKEVYDLKYIEDVYAKLESRSTLGFSKTDQLINVSVEDHDPQRAADLANAYIDMLNLINRRLNNTQGKRKRLFLEKRLKEVRTDLTQAETDLKVFQEKHHLISITEQAKAAIEGAAAIKSEIISAQTELGVLLQFGTERQMEAIMLKAKLKELQNQLKKLEQGDPLKTDTEQSISASQGPNFMIPFDDLPRLGLELMRLTREAKIQEKLFEIVVTQYEMAKIEEAKDVDTIQVVDLAVLPEKKSGPNRSRIVLVCTFLSFVAASFIVFGRRYYLRFTL